MGVRTSADEAKDQAVTRLMQVAALLQEAETELDRAIDEETWGSDTWNDEFRAKLAEAATETSRMRRKVLNMKRELD